MGSHDPELIQRWQRGDPSAFEELLRPMAAADRSFSVPLTGKADLAEDLCQEVFLRVYHARAAIAKTGRLPTGFTASPSTWRAMPDGVRATVMSAFPKTRLPWKRLGDAACQREEIARIVAACVAELPEPLRIILVLRHYER